MSFYKLINHGVRYVCSKNKSQFTRLKHLRLFSTEQKHDQNDSSWISEVEKIESESLSHSDYFQVRNSFTLKDLFDANVHLGHKEGLLNEHMEQFVYGSRLGQLIIDLDQTKELLQEALNIVAHIAYRNGIILFITRNKLTSQLVERTAKEVGEYAHTRTWFGGIFTNSMNQLGSAVRLPDLVIFLHTKRNVIDNHWAVKDASSMLIPTVGIVDTNCDPRHITYPVPGNDDSPSATELYCKLFKNAILAGKAKRKFDFEKFKQ